MKVHPDDVLPLWHVETFLKVVVVGAPGHRAIERVRQREHAEQCLAAVVDAIGRNHIAGERLARRRITQERVVGGADLPVGPAQA